MQWKSTALWGGKKVELRETQRAVTPFGGLVVFLEFFAAGWLSRSREPVSAVSSYFTQRDRSGRDLHGLLALGGGRSTTVRAHQLAAGGCGLARIAGDLALSRRRHHSQPVQALRPGTVPAFFSPACGVGSSSGFRSVVLDTVWTWTRRCTSATVGSKVRCAGRIHASLDDPRIIHSWRCWPRLTFCCTAG